MRSKLLKAVILLAVVITLAIFIKGKSPMAEESKAPSAGHLHGVDADQINWSEKNKDYWKEVLSPKQFEVCREAGTERAFSGFYNTYKKDGTYHCSNCGQPLFSSAAKFDSGTGWPSFYQAIKSDNIALRNDHSFFSSRTEVVCGRCGAHLGHVFDDGPAPTGKRFCINSVCLIHDEQLKTK